MEGAQIDKVGPLEGNIDINIDRNLHKTKMASKILGSQEITLSSIVCGLQNRLKCIHIYLKNQSHSLLKENKDIIT